MIISRILLSVLFISTSALTSEDNPIYPHIPRDFCLLPPELEYEGQVKFLEDCETLDTYPTLPMPGSSYYKKGTHPIVCCPKHTPNPMSSIQESTDVNNELEDDTTTEKSESILEEITTEETIPPSFALDGLPKMA